MNENTAPLQGLAEYLREMTERKSWLVIDLPRKSEFARWADEVEAAASAGQALGLYAEREADIKEYLDDVAPGTQGNILERIKQALPKTGDPVDMLAVCAALGFDPTNHHNAAKCPYCRPAASLPIQAVPMTPLKDDKIEDVLDKADYLYRRFKGGVRGQQILPGDSPTYWVVRATEQFHGIGTAQPARETERGLLLSWAVDRWLEQVKNRPLVNIHRRTLDDTWRQVIRYAGGDPVAIIGPSHDDLLAANPIKPGPSEYQRGHDDGMRDASAARAEGRTL